jgi:hypothetical protein
MPASRYRRPDAWVGTSSPGKVLLAGSMVSYRHACTYATFDEPRNEAATSPATNPG